MNGLVEFLRARLNEAECRERDTYKVSGLVVCPKCPSTSVSQSSGDDFVRFEPCSHTMTNEDFFAAFSTPAPDEFTLAEIDAKRRLISEFEEYDASARYPDSEGGIAIGLEMAVQFAALPFASHPEYDESWRP